MGLFRKSEDAKPLTTVGSFIPMGVDVLPAEGPVFIWLKLVMDDEGDDLELERVGRETWGETRPEPQEVQWLEEDDLAPFWKLLRFGIPKPAFGPDWIECELSESGFENIFDYNWSTVYEEDGHRFHTFWTTWALQNGIAPGQKFLVRVDPPNTYRSSYEYDEWDVEWGYDIVWIEPLPTGWVWRRWRSFLDKVKLNRELTKREAASLRRRQRTDISAMKITVSRYPKPNVLQRGVKLSLYSTHGHHHDLANAKDDEGKSDLAFQKLFECVTKSLPEAKLTLERLKTLPQVASVY